MGFLRHIIGLIAALLVTAFSATATPVAPAASQQVDFPPYHQAALAEHADVHFTARAPPLAVSNVEVTGGVTVMQGSAFAVHGQETVAALFGFGDSSFAPNSVLTSSDFPDVNARLSTQRQARHIEGALRANKRETIDWLKFTLEGAGERTHGYAFTDTTFAGCWI